MRFLLRWQHVAPGTQLRGHGGVRIAIEQLQGFEAGGRRLGAGDPPPPGGRATSPRSSTGSATTAR